MATIKFKIFDGRYSDRATTYTAPCPSVRLDDVLKLWDAYRERYDIGASVFGGLSIMDGDIELAELAYNGSVLRGSLL